MQAELMMRQPLPVADRIHRLPWLRQFWLVTRLQFSDYKEAAVFLAMFSLLMPLGMLLLMGGYVAGKGPEAAWFLAGNAVIAVTFGSTNFALARVGMMRLRKETDYYATLPVHKSAFVAALFVLGQISALPGLFTSLLIGHWHMEIPLSQVLTAVPLALLASASLTIVGAAVGGFVKNFGQLNLYSNMVYVIVMFLSPTMVPFEHLPLPLKLTSYLLPSGQATMALTEAMSGRFDLRFWALAGALLLWLVTAGTFGLKKLEWRND